MIFRRFVKSCLAAAMPAALPLAAGDAELPCQSVQRIVPWKPGGGTDIIFREVAQEAHKHLAKIGIIKGRKAL